MVFSYTMASPDAVTVGLHREQSGKRSGAGRKSGGAERSGERTLQKNDGAERSAVREVAERGSEVTEIQCVPKK